MPASRTTRPGADADIAATTTVIAGLRDRLARTETLEHPEIQSELRKLEDLLFSQPGQSAHKPGRHRSPVSWGSGQTGRW
jgi:hypothetical protein